jgi:hypothetical protein
VIPEGKSIETCGDKSHNVDCAVSVAADGKFKVEFVATKAIATGAALRMHLPPQPNALVADNFYAADKTVYFFTATNYDDTVECRLPSLTTARTLAAGKSHYVIPNEKTIEICSGSSPGSSNVKCVVKRGRNYNNTVSLISTKAIGEGTALRVWVDATYRQRDLGAGSTMPRGSGPHVGKLAAQRMYSSFGIPVSVEWALASAERIVLRNSHSASDLEGCVELHHLLHEGLAGPAGRKRSWIVAGSECRPARYYSCAGKPSEAWFDFFCMFARSDKYQGAVIPFALDVKQARRMVRGLERALADKNIQRCFESNVLEREFIYVIVPSLSAPLPWWTSHPNLKARIASLLWKGAIPIPEMAHFFYRVSPSPGLCEPLQMLLHNSRILEGRGGSMGLNNKFINQRLRTGGSAVGFDTRQVSGRTELVGLVIGRKLAKLAAYNKALLDILGLDTADPQTVDVVSIDAVALHIEREKRGADFDGTLATFVRDIGCAAGMTLLRLSVDDPRNIAIFKEHRFVLHPAMEMAMGAAVEPKGGWYVDSLFNRLLWVCMTTQIDISDRETIAAELMHACLKHRYPITRGTADWFISVLTRLLTLENVCTSNNEYLEIFMYKQI